MPQAVQSAAACSPQVPAVQTVGVQVEPPAPQRVPSGMVASVQRPASQMASVQSLPPGQEAPSGSAPQTTQLVPSKRGVPQPSEAQLPPTPAEKARSSTQAASEPTALLESLL